RAREGNRRGGGPDPGGRGPRDDGGRGLRGPAGRRIPGLTVVSGPDSVKNLYERPGGRPPSCRRLFPFRRRSISTPDKQNRRNNEIRVPRVRVIGSDGEMVGVLSRDEALQMAEDEGLDLVEIQPNADPPVCKVMDVGKFKFEAEKQANEAKKKAKQ